MAVSTPAAMSIVGDAVLIRHVYRPAVGKSFAVWATRRDTENFRFVIRQITGVITQPYAGFNLDGVDFSETVIPQEVRDLRAFTVVVRSDDTLLFLYGTYQGKVRRFRYNPTTNTLVEPDAEVFSGELPVMVPTTTQLLAFFVERDGVRRRFTLDDGQTWISPRDVVFPSYNRIHNLDMSLRGAQTRAHYLGDHGYGQGEQAGPALPLTAEVDTVLLFDGSVQETASLTEAIPSGAVAYWTMDSAHMSGSTILDQVGSNHLSLEAGTNTAAAGIVGGASGARLFDNATRWRIPAPATAFQITGNLTIEWWQMVHQHRTQHPITKAYGGEFGIIQNTDGSFAFYYGTGGGNTTPHQGFRTPPDVVKLNVWQHFCVVRDVTDRVLRWYVDGRLVAQEVAAYPLAVASGNDLYVGFGWAGVYSMGRLDQMAVFSSALSPVQVRNEYEKGLANKRLDASNTTTSLQRLSAKAPSTAVKAHATLPALPATATWLESSRNGNGVRLPVTSSLMLSGGAHMSILGRTGWTVEAWVKRNGFTVSDEFHIIGNLRSTELLAPQLSSGVTPISGTWAFGYLQSGRIFFRFRNGSGFSTLLQTGGEPMRMGKVNYVAVSHRFTVGSQSFLVVNGVVVPAQWVSGTGNEAVAAAMNAAPISSLAGDVLDSLRVASTNKTMTQLVDYFKGVAL